jgi:hypothetical protein
MNRPKSLIRDDNYGDVDACLLFSYNEPLLVKAGANKSATDEEK